MDTIEQLKTCTRCSETKPLTKFGTRTNKGKRYPSTRCNTCRKIVEKECGWRNPITIEEANRRKYNKKKEQRLSGDYISKFILEDSRQSDRRKFRSNDLDLPFIETLISQPCSYCEATDLRMTLDRICNDGGHTKDNVVPACYRCNLTRGNMPAKAWEYLKDGMKAAREAGAFGDWGTKPFSRK